MTAIRSRGQHYDYCQLSTVNCQLSTVNCQLSTVNCQLSTVNCQLTNSLIEKFTFTDYRVSVLQILLIPNRI
ncbi:MAG: hypothetical protein EAZ10_22945 [Oscillatoriales cyanobacterium]|nr:MAG: hypothetical protein EAZ10_22945 [Oscillatoriales cyanobacterium]